MHELDQPIINIIRDTTYNDFMYTCRTENLGSSLQMIKD